MYKHCDIFLLLTLLFVKSVFMVVISDVLKLGYACVKFSRLYCHSLQPLIVFPVKVCRDYWRLLHEDISAIGGPARNISWTIFCCCKVQGTHNILWKTSLIQFGHIRDWSWVLACNFVPKTRSLRKAALQWVFNVYHEMTSAPTTSLTMTVTTIRCLMWLNL